MIQQAPQLPDPVSILTEVSSAFPRPVASDQRREVLAPWPACRLCMCETRLRCGAAKTHLLENILEVEWRRGGHGVPEVLALRARSIPHASAEDSCTKSFEEFGMQECQPKATEKGNTRSIPLAFRKQELPPLSANASYTFLSLFQRHAIFVFLLCKDTVHRAQHQTRFTSHACLRIQAYSSPSSGSWSS